ncbi:Hsp20/alpha crystallin family protein [Halobaculum sp. MBLA0147]|uniref:Hsp20/alpha crystallin family protein n=1 Tax=Halobaculum sp. MBLA0147 TaxID=3079934 RepID=UPI0035265FD3
MALPSTPTSSWMESFDLPNRLFETGSDDYRLYEEDGEFVLSLDLPGYDPAEIDVTWDEGVLNVAANREDDQRNERRTYHRRFRFPKAVEADDITASYDNGVLDVTLPVETGAAARGERIPIET